VQGLWLTWEDVCRRAGGRRRYNAARRNPRDLRRARIIAGRAGVPRPLPAGLQAELARRLVVSPATISRDFKAIRGADRGALLK
jgi:hypothetical protein